MDQKTESNGIVKNSGCITELFRGHSYGGSPKAVFEHSLTMKLTTGFLQNATEEIYLW